DSKTLPVIEFIPVELGARQVGLEFRKQFVDLLSPLSGVGIQPHDADPHRVIDVVVGDFDRHGVCHPCGNCGFPRETLGAGSRRSRLGVRPKPGFLAANSEPQSDISLLKLREDFYRIAHPHPEDVLLIIEVADTSLGYDRDIKVPLYARHGIPEVWLAALEGKRPLIFTSPSETGQPPRMPGARGLRRACFYSAPWMCQRFFKKKQVLDATFVASRKGRTSVLYLCSLRDKPAIMNRPETDCEERVRDSPTIHSDKVFVPELAHDVDGG
ncbi:MAG: Uma2 family endonuclease, partial [Gammaproteobacteria bacterium]